MSDAVRGRLVFHSETGTEGGWYAWQDDAHTHGGATGEPCPWGSQGCPVTNGTGPEHWRYEGLHLFHNGDLLRVFQSHADGALWEGTVRLTRRDDVYESSDATVFSLWVNQEPDIVGVSREEWAGWFLSDLPCEVTPAYGPFKWGRWSE